jgi:hypothetical protein
MPSHRTEYAPLCTWLTSQSAWGGTIHYDPEAEQIVGDEEAARFVNIPMRAPWHL